MSLLSIKNKIGIPSDWKMVPIGKVLISSQYGTSNGNSETGVPVVGMKNLQDGKVDFNDLPFVSVSNEEKESLLLHDGDILLNRTNSYDLVGKIGFVDKAVEAVFASYLVRLQVDRAKSDPKFVALWLTSFWADQMIKKIATRAVSQANVNPTEFKKFCLVPVLPKPEQKAIADLLSTWDEAIEKTERLIQTKGKKLNALYQSYFRVDSSTTKSWEPVKVGKFVTPRNEKAVPTEEQPLYSLTIENGITEKTERYNREFLVKDAGNKTYKVVHPGDIVFNPANLRWGAIARSTVDHKVVLSPIYEVLQIKDNAIDPDFLTHALTCPRQIAIYATKTEGTLIERMAVKLDAFLLLKIRAPSSISEQKEIAKTLSNAQQEIDLLKQLAEKYKTQKRGLMQKMLTGEWRVKPEIVNQYREA